MLKWIKTLQANLEPARRDKARQDKTSQDKARQDKARQDKSGRDKALEEKAREDKARPENARSNPRRRSSPADEAMPDPFAAFPEGVRVLAIGDIHGRHDLLAAMLKDFDAFEQHAEPARSIIVTLGDVIDRGPDSSAVLDMLIERAGRQEVKAVMGNHEAMLLRFLSEPATLTDWIRFGGLETLRSYGVTPTLPLDAASVARTAAAAAERIPPEHIAFLRGMLLAWTCGPMTFVHAGLRPGKILAEQDARDMLEIREPFLSHAGSHGTYVVHGHTPVRELDVRPNRLNLDTGAFATGTLTGAIISRGSMYRLTAKAPRASA